MKKLDWLDRSLKYLERHVEQKAISPIYDKRKRELHDRASRKIRRYIKRRWNEDLTTKSDSFLPKQHYRFL